MAEKLRSRRERDHAAEKGNCVAVSCSTSRSEKENITCRSSPVIEKVNSKSLECLKSKSRSVTVDLSDGSSSEEDLGLEASLLQKHQDSIHSRSHAAAATTQDPDCFIVSLSQSNSDFNRLRPRTVFVHGGSVRPRVLIDKLGAYSIVPHQVQVLLNSDIAVTFKSIADKQVFLNLDCVVTSELPSSLMLARFVDCLRTFASVYIG